MRRVLLIGGVCATGGGIITSYINHFYEIYNVCYMYVHVGKTKQGKGKSLSHLIVYCRKFSNRVTQKNV